MWKSKFYGAFVLNRRVVLHAIESASARWHGNAGSSPLDGANTAASSPRNDLSEELSGTPDALVDFHTVVVTVIFRQEHVVMLQLVKAPV